MKQKARTEARDMPQSVHSTVGSSSFLMFLNESNGFIFKNALQFVNLWMRGIDSSYSRSYQYTAVEQCDHELGTLGGSQQGDPFLFFLML